MPTNYTATTTRVWIEQAGHFAHFTPRPLMRRRLHKPANVEPWPVTPLPVGYIAVDNSIIPIDGNNTYGICGPCMGEHVDNVLTFRATGMASVCSNLQAFEQQYFSVSGGDNGTDEQMMTGPIWGPPNGLAGTTPSGAILDDHLDVGLDAQTVQGAIAAQGFVCMALSVPNKWINAFTPAGGAVWDGPATPNPANGHYVALVGVDAQRRYILLTWGSFVYLTQAGLQSCEAELFTGFTRRAFNPATGLDFSGRSWTDRRSFWLNMGGSATAVPATPPFPAPTPGPTPTPTPSPVVTVDFGAMTISGDGWSVAPSPNISGVHLYQMPQSGVTKVPGRANTPPGWKTK